MLVDLEGSTDPVKVRLGRRTIGERGHEEEIRQRASPVVPPKQTGKNARHSAQSTHSPPRGKVSPSPRPWLVHMWAWVEEGKAEQLRAMLASAEGERVFSAVAGPKGDYTLSLELGERRRRSLRLANPRFSFVRRTYEGAFSFLIECPWRLDAPDRVLHTSFLLLEREAPSQLVLDELEGLRLESAQAEPQGWDLVLAFEGGYRLRCVSLEPSGKRQRHDWSFWCPGGSAVVGPRGAIQFPPPDDEGPDPADDDPDNEIVRRFRRT